MSFSDDMAAARSAVDAATTARSALVASLDACDVSHAAEVSTLHAEIDALSHQVAALEAQVVLLEARIKDLESQLPKPTTSRSTSASSSRTTTRVTTAPTTPPWPGAWIWNDAFMALPIHGPGNYIVSCDDPAKDFVLAAGGGLRVIFVAGKTDAAGKAIVRSELSIWGPDSSLAAPRRDPVGSERLYEFSFFVPTTHLDDNKRIVLAQWFQSQDNVESPLIFELIRPSGAPSSIVRLVRMWSADPSSTGQWNRETVWSMPIAKGRVYVVSLDILWDWHAPGAGAMGKIALSVDGARQSIPGPHPNCYNKPDGIAPRLGLYRPGSTADPTGTRREIVFGYWRIRLAP